MLPSPRPRLRADVVHKPCLGLFEADQKCLAHAPFWTNSYKHHLQLSVCPHVRHYKNRTTSSHKHSSGRYIAEVVIARNWSWSHLFAAVKYQSMNGRMQLLSLCTGGKKPSKDPLSYRPISLTSCVARVPSTYKSESIRGEQTIYDHRLLPQHSTVTQLCYLTDEWTMALPKAVCSRPPGFARHQPGTNWRRFLSSLGAGSLRTLKWMNSFLANRRQRVKVRNMHAEWLRGIPQGTGRDQHFSSCSLMTCQLILWGSRLFLQMTLPCFPVETISSCQALSKDLDSAQDWAVTWGMLNADVRWLQITSKHTAAQGDDRGQ